MNQYIDAEFCTISPTIPDFSELNSLPEINSDTKVK